MPAKVTIWNRETGDPAVMTTIDARRALKQHPTEWSSVEPEDKKKPAKAAQASAAKADDDKDSDSKSSG